MVEEKLLSVKLKYRLIISGEREKVISTLLISILRFNSSCICFVYASVNLWQLELHLF
jgi:hypothetical protein